MGLEGKVGGGELELVVGCFDYDVSVLIHGELLE